MYQNVFQSAIQPELLQLQFNLSYLVGHVYLPPCLAHHFWLTQMVHDITFLNTSHYPKSEPQFFENACSMDPLETTTSATFIVDARNLKYRDDIKKDMYEKWGLTPMSSSVNLMVFPKYALRKCRRSIGVNVFLRQLYSNQLLHGDSFGVNIWCQYLLHHLMCIMLVRRVIIGPKSEN